MLPLPMVADRPTVLPEPTIPCCGRVAGLDAGPKKPGFEEYEFGVANGSNPFGLSADKSLNCLYGSHMIMPLYRKVGVGCAVPF
jgi:hypothetical protein